MSNKIKTVIDLKASDFYDDQGNLKPAPVLSAMEKAYVVLNIDSNITRGYSAEIKTKLEAVKQLVRSTTGKNYDDKLEDCLDEGELKDLYEAIYGFNSLSPVKNKFENLKTLFGLSSRKDLNTKKNSGRVPKAVQAHIINLFKQLSPISDTHFQEIMSHITAYDFRKQTVSYNGQVSYEYYSVSDHQKKIVYGIEPKRLKEEIISRTYNNLKTYFYRDSILTPEVWRRTASYLIDSANEKIPETGKVYPRKVITDKYRKYDNCYALWAFEGPLDSSVDFPTFKKWNSWMDEPEAFNAYIGALAVGDLEDNKYVLYLHGPHGNELKSFFTKLIFGFIFGPAQTTANDKVSKDNFGNTIYLNKEWVYFADINDAKILDRDIIKQVTGNETLPVRRLNSQYQEVDFSNVNIGVVSNYAPYVRSDFFSRGRLCYVRIDRTNSPHDIAFPSMEKLRQAAESELPGYIQHCIECWFKMKKTSKYGTFPPPPSMEEAVNELIDDSEIDFLTIFKEEFEESPDHCVPYGQIKDLCDVVFKHDNKTKKAFWEWIKSHHRSAIKRVPDNKNKVNRRNTYLEGYSLKSFPPLITDDFVDARVPSEDSSMLNIMKKVTNTAVSDDYDEDDDVEI